MHQAMVHHPISGDYGLTKPLSLLDVGQLQLAALNPITIARGNDQAPKEH